LSGITAVYITAEEKRDRREARHEVQATFKRIAIRKLRKAEEGPNFPEQSSEPKSAKNVLRKKNHRV
jgi:hypothetical protein